MSSEPSAQSPEPEGAELTAHSSRLTAHHSTQPGATQPLLETRELTRQFGGLMAVDYLSFEVRQGEILSLIGPNGAGKTTVFNVISGIYPPSTGQVLFKGKLVSG